ncbi:UNVERIFIED_CONTAM: glycosyl transferase [Prevotella sp. 15_C9]
MGYWLNWSHPTTFNEKLQWLKIYNRNPVYTQLVDKYEVKQYVANKIGDKYVAKLLGVWDSPELIDFVSLPDKFVLKTTHGGGNTGVVICKDKAKLDKGKTLKLLSLAMKSNIYREWCEWPYKNVKRRIIAEEYLEDAETKGLIDYKFFCFNGKVRALFVATERQTRSEPYFNFFDGNYNSLDITQGHPQSQVLPSKPFKFDEMKALAEKLSQGFPHVRVDFYEANNNVYFGEFTFFHFAGVVRFSPNEWDYTFGNWLELPIKNKN